MPKIIVHVENTTGREATRPAFLNGKKLEYPINTPFDATDQLLNVLNDSSLKVEVLPEGGSQSADSVDSEGAVSDHGGADGAENPAPDVTPVTVVTDAVTADEQPADAPEGDTAPADSDPDAQPPAEPAANLPQLDHDGDGKPGGSLPKAKRTRNKAAPAA